MNLERSSTKIERVKVKADDVDTQLNLFDLFEREQNK